MRFIIFFLSLIICFIAIKYYTVELDTANEDSSTPSQKLLKDPALHKAMGQILKNKRSIAAINPTPQLEENDTQELSNETEIINPAFTQDGTFVSPDFLRQYQDEMSEGQKISMKLALEAEISDDELLLQGPDINDNPEWHEQIRVNLEEKKRVLELITGDSQ